MIIRVNEPIKIEIGKFGEIEFKNGCYVYVGSALGGLKQRLKRHLSNNKKKRWHIDYLLEHTTVEGVFVWQSRKSVEDKIACKLKKRFDYIKGFGSSDAKCVSHLFYSKNKVKILNTLFKALRRQSIFIEF